MAETFINDPFFRKLYLRLAEEIERRTDILANGGAIVNTPQGLIDAANTALKYRADISFLEALKTVIELGIQMDRDQYGYIKNDDGDF